MAVAGSSRSDIRVLTRDRWGLANPVRFDDESRGLEVVVETAIAGAALPRFPPDSSLQRLARTARVWRACLTPASRSASPRTGAAIRRSRRGVRRSTRRRSDRLGRRVLHREPQRPPALLRRDDDRAIWHHLARDYPHATARGDQFLSHAEKHFYRDGWPHRAVCWPPYR
jgi:hypothetical protein